MITVLGMGQSNAEGAGAGGAWSFPPSVTAWNCSTGDKGSVGTAWVTPNMNAAPFFAGHNNLMVQFCRYLADLAGDDVRLVLVTRAGTAIEWWVTAAGTKGAMYNRMRAVLAAADVSAVDLFIWHNGEASIANATVDTYRPCWDRLLSAMAADGIIGAETPIVMGELCSLWPQHLTLNGILHDIAGADSRVGVARIAGFPQEVGNDGHFSGPSLVRAGLEYVRELSKLPGDFEGIYPENAADGTYVAASGRGAYTVNRGFYTKVPLGADFGTFSLIDDDGGFKSDRYGVWNFEVTGYPGNGPSFLYLLTTSLYPYACLDSSINAWRNSIMSGSYTMRLGTGDKVYLGVQQGSATIAVTAPISSAVNRMMATYLGPD